MLKVVEDGGQIPLKETVETYSIMDILPYHHCRNSARASSLGSIVVVIAGGN